MGGLEVYKSKKSLQENRLRFWHVPPRERAPAQRNIEGVDEAVDDDNARSEALSYSTTWLPRWPAPLVTSTALPLQWLGPASFAAAAIMRIPLFIFLFS